MGNTNTTTHRPDRDNPGWCTCRGQELYFEGPPGPTGYGCEVANAPFTDLLDRLGWHIHPEAVARNMSDATWDELSDKQFDRVMAFINRARPGWG